MRVIEQIEAKLRAEFAPDVLEIEDQSHMHAGHAGAPAGGESHFHVKMRSARLAGQGRVAQQRAVYAALAVEMAGPIHALSLDLAAQ